MAKLRKGASRVPSPPSPLRPVRHDTRVSRPSSSGNGNKPSQKDDTSPLITSKPSRRPAIPCILTRLSRYQTETSRSLVCVDNKRSATEDTFRQDPIKRSEEHTSELQSRPHLVCRLLLEKK